MKLIYLCLCWIIGIYLGAGDGPLWGLVLVGLAGVAIVLLLLRRRSLFLLGFCLIALAGGIACIALTGPKTDPYILQLYGDQDSVEIAGVEGLVTADPEPGDQTTALRLERVTIKAEDEWQPVSGTALVYVPRIPDFADDQDFLDRDFPYYRYGDLLRVEGKLTASREHLSHSELQSVVFAYYPDEMELVAAEQGAKPLQWIYGLRDSLSQALDRTLSEPQNSLAQAILLGKRGSISTEVGEDLARTGTVHITAVSGLHVSIFAGIVLSFGVCLFGRRRPTYFLLALVLIWLYAVLTGWRPPVFRAAIMGSLWLFADYIGRPRSALTALLLAAAIMTGIQPSLLGDASFQLSFAAMAGLVFLTPKFQELGARATGLSEGAGWRASSVRFVISSLSVTLGAILFTLPLIAFYFGRISSVALPATFFVLPALPGIIISAALTGVVGLFALPLAQILGWVAWLFTSYTIAVVQLFSALPFATWDISFPIYAVLLYYAVLAVALWLIANRSQLRKWWPR